VTTIGPSAVDAGTKNSSLQSVLEERRAAGRKLLVPYITGGLGREWLAVAEAVAGAGADAIEIGIPFSDPMMDGPVIQEASVRALRGGATPAGIIRELAGADLGGTPLAVMTYYNIFLRMGHRRMASLLAEHGVSAVIIPDLPADEVDEWQEVAREEGIETVLLVAPTTPASRLAMIVSKAEGFLYSVGVMGVTGERASLGASALEVARRCKQASDLPVLVGIGISTPQQATEVCEVADGVVVGSAIVRRLLDGEGPEGAAALVRSFREELDH
jgi:tryptophan synthase alpha chain